ncbi:unnamed protein product [Prunus brigantina]
MAEKVIVVSIRESAVVRPAEESTTPQGSLWLSNSDLAFNNYHASTVYFYRPSASSDLNFFNSGLLNQALSKALLNHHNGRLEIDCNSQGVLFVVAESNCALDDFGDFAPTADFRTLILAVDYSGGISSYPILVTLLRARNPPQPTFPRFEYQPSPQMKLPSHHLKNINIILRPFLDLRESSSTF